MSINENVAKKVCAIGQFILLLLLLLLFGVRCARPRGINQTDNPRRWGRVGKSERESEYDNTTVVLPYVGHQMLNFILI